VKDPAFSGRDVQEALQTAAAGLGLPVSALRYVVLDPGSAGGRGVKPSPARIAVLLDASSGRRTAEPRAAVPGPLGDPRAAVRGLLRALTEAAGLDLSVEIVSERSTLEVRLAGPDVAFVLGEDG